VNPLSRRTHPQTGPPPPVRAVHLGLGAFHRSHQAWYTHQANEAHQARAGTGQPGSGQAGSAQAGAADVAAVWDGPVGIAAFTGRSPAAAEPLAAQDGLYGLLVRGPERDEISAISSLSTAADGGRLDLLAAHLSDPSVGVVTLTVTEAGYRRAGDGHLDTTDPAVAADLAAVRALLAPTGAGGRAGHRADRGRTPRGGTPAGVGGPLLVAGGTRLPEGGLRTAPGRLVFGLAARWRAGAGPVAVVPCDNLVGNGEVVGAVVAEFAGIVSAELREWIGDGVSFVSTTVDRITPAATDDDRETVARALGLVDRASVVTEPFSEWVLAGAFPAGRPAWEVAGARFVDDVAPFEQRKLCLLNGAHSLLAYAGLARGHRTVADAVGDDELRGHVERWWAEAARHLPLPADDIDRYTAALLDRFGNPRLRHLLAQIAADGSQKIPNRFVPVLRAERAAHRLPGGAAYALGAWIAHLRGAGGAVTDAWADRLAAASGGPVRDATRAVLALVAPDLADDAALVAAVADTANEIAATAPGQ
jgi:fructuronate reductase